MRHPLSSYVVTFRKPSRRGRLDLSGLGVLMLLFAAPSHAEGGDLASWSSCRNDDDCVVVQSLCPNFYWSVHWRFTFANAARNAVEEGDSDVCAPSFQPRPAQAQCLQGQCAIPFNRFGLPERK